MTTENYLLIIAAWLVAVGSFIIPRTIKKKPVSANTTLGDIANGINNLQTAIYTAMGIEIGIILTVMVIINRWT